MSTDSCLFACSHCSYRSLNWRDLTKHSFESHSSEPNFVEKCRVSGCAQTFRCYVSFNSHLSRKHRGVDIEREARMAATSSVRGERDGDGFNGLDDDVLESMEQGDGEEIEPSNALNQDCPVSSERLYRSAALFLLSAKERYQLTQTALDFITQHVQQMVSFVVDDIKEAVKKNLANHGMEIDWSELDAKFEYLRNPFVQLPTEYLQNKYYREQFNLVVS